jgi:hypothetical protein
MDPLGVDDAVEVQDHAAHRDGHGPRTDYGDSGGVAQCAPW